MTPDERRAYAAKRRADIKAGVHVVKTRKGSAPPKHTATTRERAPRRQPDVDPKAVYQAVGMFVVLGDGAVALGVPAIFGPGKLDEDSGVFTPTWSAEDRLSGTEIGKLTVALGDEALSNVELAKWLTKLGRGSAHSKLAMVLAEIAIPRMARRGLLPAELVNGLANIATPEPPPPDFGNDDGEREPDWTDSPPSVSVATGGTPDNDGGYRVGEIDPGSVPVETPPVPDNVSHKVGRRVLRREEDQDGGSVNGVAKQPLGTSARP